MTSLRRSSLATRLTALGLALAFPLAACGDDTAPADPTDTTAPPTDTFDPTGDTAEPGPDTVTPPEGFDVVSSALSRNLEPAAGEAELAALVEGNTAFALDLYAWLRAADPSDNLFFSPHSISVALAMTWDGARGDTATEMADALRFGLEGDALHDAFNRLALALDAREDVEVDEGDPFALRVVNALWGLDDYPYEGPFLDTLALHYGAGLHIVDFINAAEEARQAINAWIAAATRDLIPELIPEGVINQYTRLVLTNAIYFYAGWLTPFNPSLTVKAPFHRLDGGTTEVDMMTLHGDLPYASQGDLEVIELPYVGGDVSMVVLLPAAGAFADAEAALDPATLDALLAGLTVGSGTFRMPRLELSSKFSLKQALADLGMPIAFTEFADFTGITAAEQLLIQDVIHEGVVKIDEEGTEAAAATAVIIGTTSAPAVTFDVTVDRPYIFIIRDRPTGAVLFVGRVVDP